MDSIYKLTRSSSDAQQLSMTVKGALISLVPIIVALTGIPEADITPAISAVVDGINAGFALAGAVITIYGLLRKIYLGRWSAAE